MDSWRRVRQNAGGGSMRKGGGGQDKETWKRGD